MTEEIIQQAQKLASEILSSEFVDFSCHLSSGVWSGSGVEVASIKATVEVKAHTGGSKHIGHLRPGRTEQAELDFVVKFQPYKQTIKLERGALT
jgi:hypothetical protein